MHQYILWLEEYGLRYREITSVGKKSLFRALAIEMKRGEERYKEVEQELEKHSDLHEARYRYKVWLNDQNVEEKREETHYKL